MDAPSALRVILSSASPSDSAICHSSPGGSRGCRQGSLPSKRLLLRFPPPAPPSPSSRDLLGSPGASENLRLCFRAGVFHLSSSTFDPGPVTLHGLWIKVLNERNTNGVNAKLSTESKTNNGLLIRKMLYSKGFRVGGLEF